MNLDRYQLQLDLQDYHEAFQCLSLRYLPIYLYSMHFWHYTDFLMHIFPVVVVTFHGIDSFEMVHLLLYFENLRLETSVI